MKKFFCIAVVLMAMVNLFGQSVQKDNLIGFHLIYFQLNPGVTEAQAEKFILEEYIPADEKAYGTRDYFLKGIRGENAGKYAFMIVFKDEKARDKFYAETEEAKKNAEKASLQMTDVVEKANKLWKTTDEEPVYNDYLMIVSKGEPVHKGSLVGLHNLTLKLNENATEEQFVDYHSKYLESAYEAFDPNMKVAVMKSLRGNNMGKLAYFIVYENEEARNLYFDEDNKATQRKKELDNAVKAQIEELSKIGTYETVYTDWIVL